MGVLEALKIAGIILILVFAYRELVGSYRYFRDYMRERGHGE